jgi:hypothetical protein
MASYQRMSLIDPLLPLVIVGFAASDPRSLQQLSISNAAQELLKYQYFLDRDMPATRLHARHELSGAHCLRRQADCAF